MNLAETFGKPVVLFIDIPEIHHLPLPQQRDEYFVQSLENMINLNVPVVSAITGMFNSSMIFDLCASDRVLMLEQAICVIPLSNGVSDNATSGLLHLDAHEMLRLNLVDRTVECSSECDIKSVSNEWKKAILDEIQQLLQINAETRIEQRFIKLQTRFSSIKSIKSGI
jgi:acetyl-CoA carboxylase alpha subunit